jgi:hypothetical protein
MGLAAWSPVAAGRGPAAPVLASRAAGPAGQWGIRAWRRSQTNLRLESSGRRIRAGDDQIIAVDPEGSSQQLVAVNFGLVAAAESPIPWQV